MTIDPIIFWLGAIAALAAAVKGVRYIFDQVGELWEWLIARRRVRMVLAELASEEGWPNGSKTIADSHRALYDKVSEVLIALGDLQKAVERVITDR